jgi:hypothetical protein
LLRGADVLTQILTAVLKRHTDLSDARGYKIDGGAVDETFFGVIYTIDDATKPVFDSLPALRELENLCTCACVHPTQIAQSWLEACAQHATTAPGEPPSRSAVSIIPIGPSAVATSAEAATSSFSSTEIQHGSSVRSKSEQNGPPETQHVSAPQTAGGDDAGVADECSTSGGSLSTESPASNTTRYSRSRKANAPSAAEFERTYAWITATGRERFGDSSASNATARSVFSETLKKVYNAHSITCDARKAELRSDGRLAVDRPPDDWTDPAVWAKANPNLGVSVKKDDLARKCLKAQQLPSAVPNFLTKHLDVWINADSAWMDMRQWDACSDPSLRIEDFAGEECIVAVDIASNIDIAATVRVFRRSIDEAENAGEFGESEPRTHYYAFGRFYVPEEVAEESDNSQYAGWIDDGRLIATDGNVIDQNEIQDDLRADKELYQIREIAYDPFQATKFALELQDDGFTMVEMGATVKNFSAPMKSIEALVRARRFHHDGDPAFAWMISNIVAHVDKKDNVFPNKQTAKNKIDGGVALIMAIGRWETGEPPQGPSVYETQGVEFLS